MPSSEFHATPLTRRLTAPRWRRSPAGKCGRARSAATQVGEELRVGDAVRLRPVREDRQPVRIARNGFQPAAQFRVVPEARLGGRSRLTEPARVGPVLPHHLPEGAPRRPEPRPRVGAEHPHCPVAPELLDNLVLRRGRVPVDGPLEQHLTLRAGQGPMNRSRRRVPGGNHCGALAHRWAARALVAPALRDRISDAGPNRRRNVPGPRQVAPGPAAVPPRTNARGTCSMRRGHGGWYGIGTESPCARGKKGENGDSVPRHPRRNRFCLAEFWRLRRVWPWSWDYVKRRKQIIS